VVATAPDNHKIEVGIFGRDGISGTSLLMEVETSPHQNFIHIPGRALLTCGDRSEGNNLSLIHEFLSTKAGAVQQYDLPISACSSAARLREFAGWRPFQVADRSRRTNGSAPAIRRSRSQFGNTRVAFSWLNRIGALK
jgi:hypothetical protein